MGATLLLINVFGPNLLCRQNTRETEACGIRFNQFEVINQLRIPLPDIVPVVDTAMRST